MLIRWRAAPSDIVGLIVVFVVATFWVVIRPSPASAVCDFTDHYSRFDGYYHNVAAFPQYLYEGSSAYIVVRDGAVCSQHIGVSTAWVMIASGPSTPGGGGWGQVGFMRNFDQNLQVGNFRYFAQFADDANNNNTFEPSELDTWYSVGTAAANAVGTRRAFRVLWSSSCGCLQASIDGIVRSASRFGPFSVWSIPLEPQFMGETKHAEDNMPGRPTSRTAYTALGAQRFSDNALEPMPCTMAAAPMLSRYGRQSHGCQAFDIWTK